MGIFQSKTEDKKSDKKENDKKSASKKTNQASDKKNVLTIVEDKGAEKVLISPWITEKTHSLMDDNQYVFKVFKTASKQKIKKAIKDVYNVIPESVKIINIPRKKKNLGQKIVFRSGFKKAIIKLKAGDKIEIYE